MAGFAPELLAGFVRNMQLHIEKLIENASVNDTPIKLNGGGSRSPVLSKMFADILNGQKDVPNTTETGTLGVAISAGIATGIFKNY
jgi:L-xylulokinase